MFDRQNVIVSALRLMRAMRRHPPRPEGSLPPMVERFLCELSKNEGASSRDLCEAMDMRPSSMSELIARMEAEGFVSREIDPLDRRVSHIRLSDEGREAAGAVTAARGKAAQELTSCLSDEEAEQFCGLCDRLSEHMGSVAWGDGGFEHRGHRGPRFGEDCEGPRGRHGHHGPHGGPESEFGEYGEYGHGGPEGEFGGHRGPHGPHGPRGREDGGEGPRRGDGRGPKVPRQADEQGEWKLL